MDKCIFCDFREDEGKILLESKHFFAVLNGYPVNKGHTLIIPKRHSSDVRAMTEEEMLDFFHFRQEVFAFLDKQFNPDGYNTGENTGVAAGQTVMHYHHHVIPRFAGDVDNPRGGIRNIKEPLVSY